MVMTMEQRKDMICRDGIDPLNDTYSHEVVTLTLW